MDFGKNILRIRKQRGMSAVELARKAGINQSYLSQIENGKRSPSTAVLSRIARALNLTTSELLGEVPERLSPHLLRLLDAAKGLNAAQVDAVIALIKAFGPKDEKYLVADEKIYTD